MKIFREQRLYTAGTTNGFNAEPAKLSDGSREKYDNKNLPG
jgi:hypothetical protein